MDVTIFILPSQYACIYQHDFKTTDEWDWKQKAASGLPYFPSFSLSTFQFGWLATPLQGNGTNKGIW